MKSREAFLAVLLGVLANFLYGLFVQPWVELLKRAGVDIVPWVENLLSQPRDRLMRAGAAILALSLVLIGLLRGRTLGTWLRTRTRRRSRDVTVPLTGLAMTATAGTLTPSVAPPDPPMSPPDQPMPPPGLMTPWRHHRKVRRKKRRLRREASPPPSRSRTGSIVLPMPQDTVMNPAARIARGSMPFVTTSDQLQWDFAQRGYISTLTNF